MVVIWWKQKRWFFEDVFLKINKPNLDNKLVFFRLLAVTQKAGLGIRDSLQSIYKSETHPWVKKILKDVIEQVNEWVWLSSALEKYNDFFTTSEIELIRSAEQMWNMPDTLENMANELEKFELIKKKLKSAMMYPSVVIVVAIFAVIILLVKVIPGILTIFPPDLELPFVTRAVMAVSDYLKVNYDIVVSLIILIPILFSIAYKNLLIVKKYIDKLLLQIPVIGPLTKTFYRYRFSKLLWDFYSAWLSPLSSLDQMANIFANYHYKKKILDVKKDLEVWLEMTESFEWSWLFNPILIQIIWIWERAGNIWEVLDKMAIFYRNELDTKVEWLTKMIEPLLMVFVASIIWVIVASVFLPMADLIWSFSKW